MNPILRPPRSSHWACPRRFFSPVSNPESFVQPPEHCPTKETTLIATSWLLLICDPWNHKLNLLFANLFPKQGITYPWTMHKWFEISGTTPSGRLVKLLSVAPLPTYADTPKDWLERQRGKREQGYGSINNDHKAAGLSLCILQTCSPDPALSFPPCEEHRTSASQR